MLCVVIFSYVAGAQERIWWGGWGGTYESWAHNLERKDQKWANVPTTHPPRFQRPCVDIPFIYKTKRKCRLCERGFFLLTTHTHTHTHARTHIRIYCP